MFVNLIENEGASSLDELFVFYSDELYSNQWHPHKQNPVVSNVKNARPAGAIISINDQLYRPAQNCAHRYGHGFNLNQINQLNETEYKEEVVASIKPNWEKVLLATHTVSKVNRLHVIDVLSNKLKWRITKNYLLNWKKNAQK
jgi:hypothetical protein